MIGRYEGGRTHEFVRGENGRWTALCERLPERWCSPAPAPKRECRYCRRAAAAGDPTEVVERRLAVLWPRGLTVSKVRKLNLNLRRHHWNADDFMTALERAGRVTHAETPDGRKVWMARRVLVEAHGRTYGM